MLLLCCISGPASMVTDKFNFVEVVGRNWNVVSSISKNVVAPSFPTIY